MLKNELPNNQENNQLTPELEGTIKKFLSRVLHKGGEKPQKKYELGLVDISHPTEGDMGKINENNYQISNLRIIQRPNGGKDYHFYIGQTEFHIKEQAADDLTELISANNSK